MVEPVRFIRLILFSVVLIGCEARERESSAVLHAAPAYGQGLSVQLASGEVRTIRLSGVRAANPELFPAAAQSARQSVSVLFDQAGGDIMLHATGGDELDRYQRQIASIDIAGEDLATRLVEAGEMMVWPRTGEQVDYDRLYSAENDARQAGRGGWASGAFAVFDPDPNRLAQYLDGPIIVEGRIVGVGTARDGRVFLNYGLDWRSDFTVLVGRQMARQLDENGHSLSGLEGAIIRVRGWLIDANGPAIRLYHPAQIELVDAPEPTPLPQ